MNTLPDYDAMSDEELLAQVDFAPRDAIRPVEADDEAETPKGSLAEEVIEDTQPIEEEADADAPAEPDAGSDENAPLDAEDESAQERPEQSEAPAEGAETAADPAEKQAGAVDYEAFYKEVMSPFKANGREFTPENMEEIRQLMSKGANYGKKMAALKPHMRMLQSLQQYNLDNPEALNRLIDLQLKKPEAIKALLREAKIDPMDLDMSENSAYTPTNHQVSEADFNLTEVLRDVRTTPEGEQAVQEILNHWDEASKSTVASQPEIIRFIAKHHANGVYGKVKEVVERRVMLGQIDSSMPFVDAYKLVGDELHAAGMLMVPQTTAQQPARPAQPTPLESRPARRPVAPTPPPQARAAAAVRTTKSSSATADFDPFNMTDEEIMAATAKPYT